VFKTNKIISSILVSLGLVSISTSVSADPWAVSPGTKARAMGNSFVAIANDPSAAWHNPAGLYQMNGSNVTIEVSGAPSFDHPSNPGDSLVTFNNVDMPNDTIETFYATSWGEMAADNQSIFASYNDGDGKNSGFSLYYYSPYFISMPVVAKINDASEVFGKIEEEVSILGAGWSSVLWNTPEKTWFSSLHYGLTLELVMTDYGSSDIDFYGMSSNGGIDRVNLDESNEAVSGSVGVLSTIYKGDSRQVFSPTVKFGAVYRLKAISLDSSSDIEMMDRNRDDVNLNSDDFFNKKPSSWDMGLSASTLLGQSVHYGLFSAELSFQVGETEFDSVVTNMNYERSSIGASIRWAPIDSFVKQVELRVGSYSSESDSIYNAAIEQRNEGREFPTGLIYPNVNATSWGMQIAFDGGIALEFAQEMRTLKNTMVCIDSDNDSWCDKESDNQSLDETFTSFAFRYNW